MLVLLGYTNLQLLKQVFINLYKKKKLKILKISYKIKHRATIDFDLRDCMYSGDISLNVLLRVYT